MGGQSQEADGRGAAVTATLAEYTALRAEIAQRVYAQATLVGVGFTGLGVVVVLGNEELLSAVPLFALLMSLFYQAQRFWNRQISQYIRDQLWPHLRRLCPDVGGTWESFASTSNKTMPRGLVGVVLEGAVPAAFAGFASLAILRANAEIWLLVVNWCLAALTLAIPLLLVLWSPLLLAADQSGPPGKDNEASEPAIDNSDPTDGHART